MEGDLNLLDDFATPELDIDYYKKSNIKYRWIGLILTIISYALFAIYMDDTPNDEKGGPYIFGSILGIFLIVYIPSTILALFPSFLLDKKFPFKDRFRKFLSIASILVAGFFILAFGMNILIENGVLGE